MAVPTNATDRLIEMVGLNVGRTTTMTVGSDTLAGYILQWVNDTQKEICNRANFWFQRANTTLAFAQSATEAALPSDFKDVDGVWLEETEGWTELDIMDYLDFRRHVDENTEAKPSYYVLDGAGNILVRPIPDDAYTVRLDYWKYLADLTVSGSSNDFLDQYPDVLESGSTYRTFRYLGEHDDANIWKGQYESKVSDLVVANADRVLPDEMVIRPRPDVFGTGITRIRNR